MNFKKIGNFKIDNVEYIALMNEKCDTFYLRKENKKLFFPTEEEIIKIYKVFHFEDHILKEKYSFNAYVKFQKKLVPYVLAMSLLFSVSGCADEKDTIKKLSKNGIEVERICDSDIYNIKSVDVRKINLDDYKMAASIFGTTSIKEKCVPSNFNLEGVEQTNFESLYKTIENMSCSSEIKKVLKEAVKNIKDSELEIDLDVLNYNLSRATFKTFKKDEKSDMDGFFDPFKQEISISDELEVNSDRWKSVIIHEAIGHGMASTYVKEKAILCDPSDICITIDEEGNLKGHDNIGFSLDEALAEIITSRANLEKLNSMNSGYSTNVYYLVTLCDLVECSVSDFANYGVGYLLERMKNYGVENPLRQIMSLDLEESVRRKKIEGEELSSGMHTIIECTNDIAKKKIDSGIEFDEVYTWCSKVLNKYREYIDLVEYNGQEAIYNGKSMFVYPIIVEDYVLSEIENMKKNIKNIL